MSGFEELMETLMKDPKFANSKNIAGKLYQDQPILIPASQMANYTPPRYREMRALAKGRDASLSDASLFYRQGKFMEDHEDQYEYTGEFLRYFPTYQVMSDPQLRGYFSWRTRVRRGVIQKTSLSFAFLYVYELLNQIGVPDPLSGFHALKGFWAAYRELDARLDHYLKQWMRDYVVYYSLSPELLEDTADQALDRAALTLLGYRERSPREVLLALNSLSTYDIQHSRFYKQHPQDVEEVVYRVFESLWEHCAKHCKSSLMERFFGKFLTSPYIMFQSAVFCEREPRREFTYEVNSIHRYRCQRGSWSCERFFCYRGKSQQAGALLKAVDFLLRQRCGFPSTLKVGTLTKLYQQIIGKQIDQYLEEKRARALPRVEIDVSKLQGIRLTALDTQRKLIVEELEAAAPLRPAEGPAQAADSAEEPGQGFFLTPEECRFLRCLLDGAPPQAALQKGQTPALLADAVNEKLYDRFGDTVILMEGDAPTLAEDYLAELKGMLQP